jgi:uncharacterized damage-inducible protein DinB
MSDSDSLKEIMLTRIDEHWNRLIQRLEAFPEKDLLIPDVIGIWSLKDLIGHLETWDRIAILKIKQAEQGNQLPWWQVIDSPYRDIDEFNEADAASSRHKSIEQLWRELHARHEGLIEQIRTTGEVPEELIAVDTWEHYLEHLRDIEAWEQRVGSPDNTSSKRLQRKV